MSDSKTDLEVLAKALLAVVEKALSVAPTLIPSQPSESKLIDILSYDGKMKASGFEKFNSPCFISAVNIALNEKEAQAHKTKGAVILYADFENASKFYKALGFPAPDDEDDLSMMECNGKFCQLIAGAFKDELLGMGYAELFLSQPDNFKNSALEGIEYSRDQKIKSELSFYYFKKKAFVVELTLAPIPMKK